MICYHLPISIHSLPYSTETFYSLNLRSVIKFICLLKKNLIIAWYTGSWLISKIIIVEFLLPLALWFWLFSYLFLVSSYNIFTLYMTSFLSPSLSSCFFFPLHFVKRVPFINNLNFHGVFLPLFPMQILTIRSTL